jgi:hypothetical protein
MAELAERLAPVHKQLVPSCDILELKGLVRKIDASVPILEANAKDLDAKKLEDLAARQAEVIRQIETAIKESGDPARLAEVEARYPELFSSEVRDKAKQARLQDLIALARLLDPPGKLNDPTYLKSFADQLKAYAGQYDPKELRSLSEQFRDIVVRRLGRAGRTKLVLQVEYVGSQFDQTASLSDLAMSRELKRRMVTFTEQLKTAAKRAGRDNVREIAGQIEDAVKRLDVPGLIQLVRKLDEAVKPGTIDDLGDFTQRLSAAERDLTEAAKGIQQAADTADWPSLRELAEYCRRLAAGFGKLATHLQPPAAPAKPTDAAKPAVDLPIVVGAFQELTRLLGAVVDELSYFGKLDALEFTDDDRLRLGEAVMARELSRWARGDEPDDVNRAMRLFDWTIRNIQLEPDRMTRDGKAVEHMLQYPWETLIFGRGTAAERAAIFILLARQQGLDAAMLALEDPADTAHHRLRPWAVGVLSEGNVYVFDPLLGLPIPAPGSPTLHESGQLVIRPATLSQLAADDHLLRQLDVDPQHPYPVKAADLKKVVAQVDAQPWSLAERMKLVEARLVGDDRMVLFVTPSAQAERFKAGKGITGVGLWRASFDTVFQRVRLRAEYDARHGAMMAPFIVSEVLRTQAAGPKSGDDRQAPMFWESNAGAASQQSKRRSASSAESSETNAEVPLLAGRMLHLKGAFLGDPSATAYYQMCRLSDRQLAQMSEGDAQRKQLAGALRTTKQFATFWLGLVAFEQRNYAAARDYLATRTLEASAAGPWTVAAKYNLGRIYEIEKEYAKAIRQYNGNDAAVDAAGCRLRARWLASLAKTAVPAKPETAGAAKSKDEKSETPDLPGLPDLPSLPDAGAAGKKPETPMKSPPAKPPAASTGKPQEAPKKDAAPKPDGAAKQERTSPQEKVPQKKSESAAVKK